MTFKSYSTTTTVVFQILAKDIVKLFVLPSKCSKFS